jgi:sulfide:quinone oxidoreductase
VPSQGEVVIAPGAQRLHAKRVIALPELFGPALRGLPVSENGFLGVDRYGRMHDVGPVFAAGDAVDFPVKQGGISSQQADVVAESIAAMAGAAIEPQPFTPVLHGVLLTDNKPRYISAQLTGTHVSSSQFSETPIDGATQKIAARYLSPYLERIAPVGAAEQ